MIVRDKHGWPVETFTGRPFTNFLRRIIHGDVLMTLLKRKRSEA